MYKASPYSLKQIRDSKLLDDARVQELEHLLEATPVPALKPDGSAFPNLLIVPTLNGESAFLVDRPHAREYMNKCMLAYFLTEAESQLLQDKWHSALSQANFARQLEAARHKGRIIPESEWEGGVFHGDSYFASLDEFYDDTDPEDVPEFLEAAQPRPVIPKLDAGDILDGLIADNGWENMDITDLNGIEELQAALNAFVTANTSVKAYFADPKTFIQLFPRIAAL